MRFAAFPSSSPIAVGLAVIARATMIAGAPARTSAAGLPPLPAPIHLDDIHFMVSDEAATVAFLEKHLDACEMAHADRPIDYVRYLSVRYLDPTLTITGPTPANEPDELRARTTSHVDIVPAPRDAPPHFGVHWVGFSVANLETALRRLQAGGVVVAQPRLALPQAPGVRAALVHGPDNIPLAIVERAGDRGSLFGMDHLMLLVKDAAANSRLFEELFRGQVVQRAPGLVVVRVADATLVLAEPRTLGLDPSRIAPPQNIPWASTGPAPTQRVTVNASVEHIGFLYADIPALAAAAQARGYHLEYPPLRYAYKGRPTPFTSTEFMTPDGFSVEVVSAAGRVGPHAYYKVPCPSHD